MIKIRDCQNGAILQFRNEAPILFIFDDENKEGLLEMLYEIANQFDLSGKYSKERIRIKIEHGNSYKCKDKNCQICKEN